MRALYHEAGKCSTIDAKATQVRLSPATDAARTASSADKPVTCRANNAHGWRKDATTCARTIAARGGGLGTREGRVEGRCDAAHLVVPYVAVRHGYTWTLSPTFILCTFGQVCHFAAKCSRRAPSLCSRTKSAAMS